MRSHARVWFLTFFMGVLLAAAVPAMAQAAPGLTSFFAANCNKEGEKAGGCKKVPPAEEEAKAKLEGFTQAGGHPNMGVTDFTVNIKEVEGHPGVFEPEGKLEHIRTDVAPGLSTNPEAVAKCSQAAFKSTEVAPGFFLKSACSEAGETSTLIGENSAVAYVPGAHTDLPLSGKVYNLVQPEGRASDFGVALEFPAPFVETVFKGTPLEHAQLFAHTYIEGGVEWGAEAEGTGKADYHDYFEIKVATALPLISSRLVFKGNIGNGGFITNATSCNGVGAPQLSTRIKLKFEGVAEPTLGTYTSPIELTGCGLVPFEPGFALEQGTKAADTPDALTTTFSLPHDSNPGEGHYDTSQVKDATVTLPEGLTMNPSAANGLEDCTPAQIGIGTTNPIACPEGSKLGTVSLEVPGLPAGSLQGSLYLGGPASGPITGPPYVVYVAAESARYGVVVRVKGNVTPNEETGRLTTTFTENPEQPFTSLTIHLNGGPLAPLANGVKCEASTASTTFTPFTNTAAKSPTSNFEVTGCPATLPFSLGQSIEDQNAVAGSHTSFSFNWTRADGQQYLGKIKTTLPEGLIGAIPAITLCGEPQAAAGSCPSSSRIGMATVTAGAGRIPYTFSGPVYMTGPYAGAPFGLSIAVPAVAGPFNLGTVVTRAAISIDPVTTRVTAESTLPTIVKGVPLRLRSINVVVNRQGFLYNPTSCETRSTETTLTSTFGAVQSGLNSPLTMEGCGALPFKPAFAASSTGNFSRQNGAALETTLTQPGGQANIKSVLVTLPKQLPSRLTTLQKACLPQTFAANPFSCPEGSMVGTVRAVTPTLPGVMSGPAYLVARGGAQFPDLDLVLEGSGVRVILKGNTNIKNGITTTFFETTPDVPVSSVTVSLPTGPHSALAAYGDLCTAPLTMPTVITGWNGLQVKQNTKISVTKGCGVRITGRKVRGNAAYLTVKTFAAGRITGSGAGVSSVTKKFRSAQSSTTLKLPLNGAGKRRHRPFSVKLRVAFVPSVHGVARSNAYVTVRF
jgi:hypothetical protein